MHADDFRLDRYGVVTGLKNGGYSDDMTLAAIAGNILIDVFYATDLVRLHCTMFSWDLVIL